MSGSSRSRSQWREPRRIRPPGVSLDTVSPTRMQPPTPVYILLASAIQQESRLSSLKRCLMSLAAQTVPARVYVAWHATKALRSETEAILGEFARASAVQPRLLESPEALTQMQHLDRARHALTDDVQREHGKQHDLGNTWCLFSDDDDISHPNRVSWYAEVVQSRALPRRVPGVLCARVAMRNVETRPSSARSRALSGAADVDAALRDGDVTVREGFHEFWCYCVRLHALAQFFDSTPPGLLAHRLADLRLRQWLAASAPLPYLEQALGPKAKDLRWAYFYDRDSEGHDHAHTSAHSHEASVRAVDEERSRRLGRGLPYAMGDDPRDGPGLPLTLIAQMRDVGEMATVIGFDGPKLGVRLPRAQRTREIRSLLLEALQKPVDHWARCPPDLKAGLQKAIEELGEELLATAESFLAAGAARTQRSS